MIRFSRDKYLRRRVKFSEFQQTALALVAGVRAHQPSIQVSVRTCEDAFTYSAAQITFMSDPDVEESLARRPRYTLEEYSEKLWLRSFETEMVIRDAFIKEPFMICLRVNRVQEPNRLVFYYQSVSRDIEAFIESYRRSGWLHGIGDGFPKRR